MEGGEGVRVKALDFHLRDRRVNLATREMARGLATEFRGWQLLAVPIPDGEGREAQTTRILRSLPEAMFKEKGTPWKDSTPLVKQDAEAR